MGDIADTKRRNNLMFDLSFDRSGTYFTVLQALRVFTDTITEAHNSIEIMKQRWSWRFPGRSSTNTTHFDKMTQEILNQNWEKLIAEHWRLERGLLDYIDKKSNEVKSLRDGVSVGERVLARRLTIA